MSPTLDLLRNVPLFSDLDEEELQSIEPLCKERMYKKSTILFFEDDIGIDMYIIKSGLVKIYQIADAKEINLALFRDGDFFGEMAIIQDGFTRSATAETMEPTVVYTINHVEFHRLLLASPKLCLRLLEFTAQRLRNANEQIHDLTFLDVRSRIMKNIYRLSEDYGKPVPGGLLIDLKLTHQQLANMVGTVRESVSKVLQELQDQKVIAIANKRIIVHDIKKLKLD